MKKIFVYILVLALFSFAVTGCVPAGKEVQLNQPIKVIQNADLDYQFLDRIDQVPPPYPAGSNYQIGDLPTVKGEYTVYKYLIEYVGKSAEKGESKFHDLLVIKTDSSGKILDAYKYTLEWADSPSLALYRMKSKELYLKPDLKINDLGFAKFVPAKMHLRIPERHLAAPTPEQ